MRPGPLITRDSSSADLPAAAAASEPRLALNAHLGGMWATCRGPPMPSPLLQMIPNDTFLQQFGLRLAQLIAPVVSIQKLNAAI